MPTPYKTVRHRSPHSMTRASSSHDDRAPPAPRTIPRISAKRETEAFSPLQTISSTHKRLIEELGRDAHVLNYIPITGVTMVYTRELGQCLTQKMLIGTCRIGSKKLDVWAFLSAEIRAQNGVPHIMMYAGSPGTNLLKYTNDQMDDPKTSAWCEAFNQVNDTVRRSVFIKTCFILKGAELPPSTQFTAKFLKELRILCRSFKASEPKPATPTPPPLYQKSMMARKSQQISPDVQLFSLPVVSMPEDRKDLQRTSHLSTTQPVKSPPTEPAAMRKNQKINPSISLNPSSTALKAARSPLIDSMKKAATTIPSPALGFDAEASSVSTSRPRDHGPLLEDRPSTPTATNKQIPANAFTRQSTHALTATWTTAMTPPRAKLNYKHGHTNDFVSYQAARGEMSDIMEELEQVEAAAKRNKKKYDHLRDEMKRSIDVDMKEHHKADIKAMLEDLAKKHKAEESAEKAKYRALVAEYEQHRDSIDKQRQDALLRKSELDRHLKRKRERLSREEILAYLEQDADEKHTHKRVQKRLHTQQGSVVHRSA